MYLRRFTNYLLKNRWQALAITFAITAVPVIGVIGIIIAAFITLVKGTVEGALFAAVATIPFLLSLYTSHTGMNVGLTQFMLWGAVGVAVFSNILTYAFAVMLRRQTSWSVIVQIATLLGVLVISVVHLVYPEITQWWATQLQASFEHAQKFTSILTTANNAANEARYETINTSKMFASGFLTTAILLNAMVQLIMARWWQSYLYKPISLRRELHNIRLSPLAGVLLIISVVFAYMGNSVVLDIMPVTYLLFACAGLSVIHYTFGMMHSPVVWFWLALLYTSLLLSVPMSIFLLSIIALVDIWFDLRKRFKKI